jgi:hypothetical protein
MATKKKQPGRKSKLTPEQWEEVRKERLAGSGWAELERKWKVNEATIRSHLREPSGKDKNRVPIDAVQTAARKSVENDLRDPLIGPVLEKMGDQDRALFHAHKSDLLEIVAQMNLASRYSAQNAHKLARMAQIHLGKVDEEAAPGSPEAQVNDATITYAMALQAGSNESAKQPMKLLEITFKAPPPPPEDKPIRVIGGLPERDYGNR